VCDKEALYLNIVSEASPAVYSDQKKDEWSVKVFQTSEVQSDTCRILTTCKWLEVL